MHDVATLDLSSRSAAMTGQAALSRRHRRCVTVGSPFLTKLWEGLHVPSYFQLAPLPRGSDYNEAPLLRHATLNLCDRFTNFEELSPTSSGRLHPSWWPALYWQLSLASQLKISSIISFWKNVGI
ncbi:hypothetical protein EVAR_57026_1 [Eumeta japonica]|uniref:Uncharacterized protein n=1 Tax=Eumeta variegata TaxID=151549 RepID=A0A4C2AFA6_EUMVA|nr:hypothetical protein EVAR_57026_1 [Eumeta japonica]